MLSTIRKFLLSLVCGILGAPLLASAGQVTGVVSWVMVRGSDGLTYVAMVGTPSGQPGCATGGYWMIANENSQAGKKQYAMLLTAKATGATIAIHGTNTCIRWPDGEDIETIQLAN
jgi:hypothetical protein